MVYKPICRASLFKSGLVGSRIIKSNTKAERARAHAANRAHVILLIKIQNHRPLYQRSATRIK